MNAYSKYNSNFDLLMKKSIQSFNYELEKAQKNLPRSIKEVKERNYQALSREISDREIVYKITKEYCIKESECIHYNVDVYTDCMDVGPLWAERKN